MRWAARVHDALGVRLGEATTPLVDKVVGAIKADASPATAKSCRSVISGVMGLAVRYGAVPTNPVREAERIESRPRRETRALTMEERALLKRLQEDEKARRRDLPDLVFFMLATGVRIGEALAGVVRGRKSRLAACGSPARSHSGEDVYLGRRAVDSQAALALEAALRDTAAASESNGKTMANEEGQTP